MATIDPTLREVLRSRLGREPTHKEMCDAATNGELHASELDPALVRAAVDAYDAERCRRHEKWYGHKNMPMSATNKRWIAPMIAATLGVMLPYRCDDCGVTLPVGLLKSGCPKCGRTMVPAVDATLVAERRACADIARNGCLVPPDGGEPTEAERLMCDAIAAAILARN